MFTQSMPALAQALSGALPEAALKQLMQSLGNCQQPLTHRGAINLQPMNATDPRGLARPGAWRPSDYTTILPRAGDQVYVDIAGDNYNDTSTTNNYDGHQFHFPINQDFNYNNYFGGDTLNVAGNSIFNNSTHQTLNTTNLNTDFINNTYVGNDGRDGVDGRDGRDGVTTVIFQGGPGGGNRGPISLPFQRAQRRILKSITVNGTVSVPHVTELKVVDNAITVGTTTSDVPLDFTGKVEVPTVESATISTITATGTVTVPTVTGVTLSGATAGGTISYDTYPTATCSPLSGSVSLPTGGSFTAAITGITASAALGTLSGTVTTPTVTGVTLTGATAGGNIAYDTYPTATCAPLTGSVSLPTGGNFTAAITGITASAGLGTLSGKVTIPIPTSGYLDASCKLVLVTTNTDYTVTLSGAPSVSVGGQTSVSGTVSLTGSTSTPVSIPTPAITLTKSSGSASVALAVAGGTYKLTSGTTSSNVTFSGEPSVSVGGQTSVSGSVTLTGSTAAPVSIATPTITPNKASGSASASLSVSGGTFTLSGGATSAAVTVSATSVAVSLTAGTIDAPVSVSGTCKITVPTGTGTLDNDEVSWEEEYEKKKLDLRVVPKTEVLVYVRPRGQ